MSKDFKEKYSRICSLKDRALSLLEMGMNQDVSSIDAKEIGELMDIVKDAEEAIKYAEEACYYAKVTEAMDDSSKEEKSMYLNKYIPEYEGRFYTEYPIKEKWKDDWKDKPRRTIYDPMMEDDFRNRMYYSNMGSNGSNMGNNGGNGMNNGSGMNRSNGNDSGMRNPNEGRSPMTRRTYMDMKEHNEPKEKTNHELEKYISDLGEDITEMIGSMDTNEKAILKQKLATLVNKM